MKFGPEPFLCRDGRALTLKSMVPEDAAQYQAFNDVISTETIYTLRYPGRIYPADQWAAAFLKDAESPVDLSLGAFDGGNLIAQAAFHALAPGNPWVRHAGHFGMMILKGYWDQGLGRRLLGLLLDHARAKGFKRVEATVRVANERAVRMYGNAGLAIEGTRKNAAFIDGRYHDEYYIAKIFE